MAGNSAFYRVAPQIRLCFLDFRAPIERGPHMFAGRGALPSRLEIDPNIGI